MKRPPLLCQLFGHRADPGHYGRVEGGPVDGLGMEHATLRGECGRCGAWFTLGRFHRDVAAYRAAYDAERAAAEERMARDARARALADAAPALLGALSACVENIDRGSLEGNAAYLEARRLAAEFRPIDADRQT